MSRKHPISIITSNQISTVFMSIHFKETPTQFQPALNAMTLTHFLAIIHFPIFTVVQLALAVYSLRSVK